MLRPFALFSTWYTKSPMSVRATLGMCSLYHKWWLSPLFPHEEILADQKKTKLDIQLSWERELGKKQKEYANFVR